MISLFIAGYARRLSELSSAQSPFGLQRGRRLGSGFPTTPEEEEATQGEQTECGRLWNGKACSVYCKLSSLGSGTPVPVKAVAGGEKKTSSAPAPLQRGSVGARNGPLKGAIDSRCAVGEDNEICVSL
jgi:hypothetical protein